MRQDFQGLFQGAFQLGMIGLLLLCLCFLFLYCSVQVFFGLLLECMVLLLCIVYLYLGSGCLCSLGVRRFFRLVLLHLYMEERFS